MQGEAPDDGTRLSVGISLNQIWVIVWFAAGIVALVTGIMWGARSDVSFALQIIASKALPVLILGGLLHAKLMAFAASSYVVGVAGAMMVFLWYGGAEYDVFNIDQSFFILFMVIIGADRRSFRQVKSYERRKRWLA